MAHLRYQNQPKAGGLLTHEHFDAIAKAMAASYDWGYGGWGFSRYSTDNFWRVPHFEK